MKCLKLLDIKNRYPANHRKSGIILDHVKRQQKALPIDIKVIALDAGYNLVLFIEDWNYLESTAIQQFANIRIMLKKRIYI